MFDRIVSIVMFFLGTTGFYLASQLPKPIFAGHMGSGVFPQFISGLIVLVSIFLFFESKPIKKEDREKSWDMNMTYILLGLIAFIFLFERLGFMLSSAFLIFGLGLLLKAKRKLSLIIVAILFPSLFYFLFKFLGINLPSGILPF